VTPSRSALFGGWALLAPALIASLVLFATPLVYLLIDSFKSFSMTTGVGGFTLRNYERLLTDPYYLLILANTFRLAALAALLCLVIGYPLALLLRRAPARLRGLLVILVIAPLLVSVVVRTFGWVVILGEFGLLNHLLQGLGVGGDFARRTHLFNEVAVAIGLVHVFLPFMVLALYSALQKQDDALVRAACNLGASPLRAFALVTLPLSLPGIVAGTTTVFALAAGAYVTVAVLGGSKVMVMAVLAYQQSIGLTNWQLGAAIGIVLLVGTTAILQAYQRAMRRAFPLVLDL
jgi:putative spermidine/putrescine transport system permease protein